MIDYNKLEKVGKRIIKEQKASITMLQRLFRFDYPKAKEYIDKLCELDIIKKKKDKYVVRTANEDVLYNNIFVDKYPQISRCDQKDNSPKEIKSAQFAYGSKRSKIQPYYEHFFRDLRKFNRMKKDYCPCCEAKTFGRIFDKHISDIVVKVYEDQHQGFYNEMYGQYGKIERTFCVCPKCGMTWCNTVLKSNPQMNKFYIFNAKDCEGEQIFETTYLEAFFKDDPSIQEIDENSIVEDKNLPF